MGSIGVTIVGTGSCCLGGVNTIGSGSGAGAGIGTGDVFVGVGTEAGAGGDGRVGDEIDAAKTAPVSRLTRLGGAVFPEKNSEAVSAGSSDWAGG